MFIKFILLLIFITVKSTESKNICRIPAKHTLSITYKHHTSHLLLHPNATHPDNRYGHRSEVTRCYLKQNLWGRCTVIVNGHNVAYGELEFVGKSLDELSSVMAKIHMRPAPHHNAHIRGLLIGALYNLATQCGVDDGQVCVLDLKMFAAEWNQLGIFSSNKQQSMFCVNHQDEDMHGVGGYLRYVEPLVRIYNSDESYRDKAKKPRWHGDENE